MLTLPKPKKAVKRKQPIKEVLDPIQSDHSYFDLEELKFKQYLTWGTYGVSAALSLLMLYLFGGVDWFFGLLDQE